MDSDESIWSASDPDDIRAKYSEGNGLSNLMAAVDRRRQSEDGLLSVVREEGPSDVDAAKDGSRNVPAGPRGAAVVRGFQSWQDMETWFSSFRRFWYMKPTEVSRLWTQLCQVHTRQGKRGPLDERDVSYPDAPLFSEDGRGFLGELTRATAARIKFTLHGPVTPAHCEFWEKMRLRSPDVGRILWAMGKMQWTPPFAVLLAMEEAIVKDLNCPWNRPRYMTTALWGICWANPVFAPKRLLRKLQTLPDSFWQDMTVQNCSNYMWAMSQMRWRPSQKLLDMLQAKVLQVLQERPEDVHPQNVGDMVQALAALRVTPRDGLLAACDSWMRSNVNQLLPNHVLAFLNGVALLGELGEGQYYTYCCAMQRNLGRVHPAEHDHFAARVFVLAHLTVPEPHATPPHGADLRFLESMSRRGLAVTSKMLASSGADINRNTVMRCLSRALSSVGYYATIGPFEALDSGDSVTPLVPEMYVRPAAASEGSGVPAGLVGLQVIEEDHCLRNVKAVDKSELVLGEHAIARRVMTAEGLPIVQVFTKDLPCDGEQLKTHLLDLLTPYLAPGPPGEPLSDEDMEPLLEERAKRRAKQHRARDIFGTKKRRKTKKKKKSTLHADLAAADAEVSDAHGHDEGESSSDDDSDDGSDSSSSDDDDVHIVGNVRGAPVSVTERPTAAPM